MPKKILDLDTPFRRNERVVTTTDLVGAPEGTYGKVKLSNGLHTTNNWPRYWVRFDNGEFMGQVSHTDLVRPHLRDAWADREAERAAAAEAAANASAAAADTAAGGGRPCRWANRTLRPICATPGGATAPAKLAATAASSECTNLTGAGIDPESARATPM